ncbi:MAG: fucose isomerase [Lachnospiraceae bacterium]|jgi:L-fucose isomerase-like protein|nr:fucose isomerase [Lachnospiraceae bacterium]MCI8959255.1 fucose isomerase [Lachnospiraceae bacterium]
MSFQVAYIPVGVGTFHLESARTEFEKSKNMISQLTGEGVYPDKMLLTLEDLDTFLDRIHPDLIILQNITFANAAYASRVLKRFACPILLWTLREPVIDGGRLRLNSLTGAYSAANAIREFRQGEFEYVFGSPEEETVQAEVGAAIRAARVRYQLGHLKLAAIGHTPQGFGFGRALDTDLMKTFGVTLEAVEARELIGRARGYEDGACEEELAEAGKALVGLEETPEQNRKDFARLYKAYKEYVKENGIGALASRCWPDFFTEFGTPVCGVLSLLNASGLAASCEADVYGALSMYIGSQLTGKPVFFGDPVSMDEKEGTVTYWHCGMAACSLARADTGARVGVHPNRKIGPVMDFGCQAWEQATVFRVGRKPDGSFRFFIAGGEVLDKPKQFCGTSVVVKTKQAAKQVISESVKDGWEPHFVVIYQNVEAELEKLAHMTGAEVCRY